MPPKISKVISTTILQYGVLLFLVYRWLKCRISCALHISNDFWQRKELTLNCLGQNKVGGIFLLVSKMKQEGIPGVDSSGLRPEMVRKMLGIMFRAWDFSTSQELIGVEYYHTTFPRPPGDMGDSL